MKKLSAYTSLSVLTLMILLLTGCQAIGDIFKAGVWVGVLGVVIVIVIIIRLIAGGKK
ncbi:phosphatidate cytidylyltransferase [Panacibacter ginsenosidivorans]|uniref:Phosphatidate cytidylyltransferase n=1 Tax=Panacibacter ginsenosidivorans TaxID=1813871 RepID=A0A5B8V5R5_9BACT|nr:phosphatidate cytidylyltransferase [Panacibacter ginsenosidivorans]QEC66817.1 phosphatidate cytidylyltransferase [Panacibacter ginsenosidivorans]